MRHSSVALALTFSFVALAACGGGDSRSETAAGDAAATPQTPTASAALLSPDSALLAEQAPDTFRVLFETSKGNFTVVAYRSWSPLGVDRFYYLASNGFFDDVRFFRTLPGFVAQFGINGVPAVNEAWGSRNIPDEPVVQGNNRGRITYAKSSLPNSRTTQFFINLANNNRLDSDGFAAFGEVVDGMPVVESLYGGYGDSVDQGMYRAIGTPYVTSSFPQLDYIKTTKILP